MHRTVLTLAAAATLAGPAFAQSTPEALADAFCAAIVAEDANAIGALYTEDADSYGPDGSTVKGRAAIIESWGPMFEAFDAFSCTLDRKGEIRQGKSHTAWGVWTITATPVGADAPIVMQGRFMDVSVKTKAGWRYLADHASMSTPAEGQP